MQKQSFGNGFGVNRKVGGASALGAAIPPLSSVIVKPGVGKAHHSNVNFTPKIGKRTAGK
jgi:hypothetical protein